MPMSVVRECSRSRKSPGSCCKRGRAQSRRKKLRSSFSLFDLGPDLLDYGDTAAAMANLDLVISVCTSVAHLAGAMGRPVWLLLGTPSDWRWLDGARRYAVVSDHAALPPTTPAGWSEVV